ncbi:MAG: hypothetical protein WC346_08135 [Methanogenium sp.]|jgi:uncharacterized protein YcbK (DUF882 family)
MSNAYERLTWPYLSPPRQEVKTEYESRIITRNFSSKTPFMKMTSGLLLKRTTSESTTRAVLNPLNTISERYTSTSGFKPKGGISGVSIKYKNDIGTVRTADVTWQVYTKLEFDTLDEFFMNPGKLVLLEWGWADGANSKFSDSEIETLGESKFEKLRRQKIKESGCNYDAMLGLISNFDWSYSEGKYTCVTTLISPGAFFGDENLNANAIAVPDKNGDMSGTYPSLKNIMIKFLNNEQWLNDYYGANSAGKDNYVSFNKSGQKYISWALFEALINQSNPVNSVFSGDVYISCPSSRNTVSGKKVHFLSIDPEIAIWNTNNIFANQGLRSFTDSIGRGLIKNIYLNIKMVSDIFDKSANLNQVFTNIYANLQKASCDAWNFRMINRTITSDDVIDMESAESLKSFYSVNLGGDITTTVDEKYTYVALTDQILRNGVISFDVLGGNSAVTDITLNSKMPGAVVMSMIAAADSKYTLLSGFPHFVGIGMDTDRINSIDTFADVTRERVQERIIKDKMDKFWKQLEASKQSTDAAETFVSRYGDWEQVSLIAYSEKQQRMLITDQGSLSILLPIEMNVTLFGISGFSVGNIITADVVPEAYKKNAYFQIIGIDDTIDSSGWRTALTSRFRNISKTSKTLFPDTPDTDVQAQDEFVKDNIAAKGNPDELENDCFGKYKLADLNMNHFGESNEITIDVKKNLTYLCKEFLRPLNEFLKMNNYEISIISAFRSKSVDAKYGEPIDNLHTFGCAVDLKVRDLKTGEYVPPFTVAHLINLYGLKYDIMVIEDYWLHVGYVNEAAAGRSNRKLKYKLVFDNTTYIKSLVPVNL